MPWTYHVVYTIALLLGRLARLVGPWRINGVSNVPQKGSLLVVANHMSAWDIPMLAVSLGREASFMAKEEMFRHRLPAAFWRSLGAFPVHRGKNDLQSIRRAKQILTEGRVVIMFPEGSRSTTGQLQEALTGPVIVALRGGAPVLPVAICGTEKMKGLSWLVQRPPVTFNIGQPFQLPDNGVALTKERRAELTGILMGHIAELLPVQYKGYYGKTN